MLRDQAATRPRRAAEHKSRSRERLAGASRAQTSDSGWTIAMTLLAETLMSCGRPVTSQGSVGIPTSRGAALA